MRIAAALILAHAFAMPCVSADAAKLRGEIDARTAQIEKKAVNWRRDLHQHPELSNREVRTSKAVADHLRSLGIEVRTGVGRTGVVGLIRGGLPGRVVALRADMDALPVAEEVDLPFASKVRADYNGQEVGVMHACGHDNHVAILMAVAEVLAGMRRDLPGTVKLIFQPAEEGAPPGERGGAGLMIEEGVLENPRPDAIFALHVGVIPAYAGHISYRAEATMAAADQLTIRVRGVQTHGAMPWQGVDPVVVGAQIVLGLQTIASRQADLTRSPVVITVGSFRGGVRHNIVPDAVVMNGTIRCFDPEIQEDLHARIRRTAEMIAQSAGATAEVKIEKGNPVTYNDPKLTERMLPTLKRVAGENGVSLANPQTGAEDFALYQKEIPGLLFFLGVVPKGQDLKNAAPNHSPHFFADEAALPTGVRALANLALDFLLASSVSNQ